MRRNVPKSAAANWLPDENTALWLTAGVLLAFSLVALLDRHVFGHISPLFWDLPVYARAVDLLAVGQNPYDSALLHGAGVPDYLFFISPPAVAMLFAAIAWSPLHPLFEPLLFLLHAIAIAGTPILLGRLLFGGAPARLALAAAAFLTLFACSGLAALGAMNNGSVLHVLILAAALPGFTRNRWTAFHIALTVAAIFKPYYAAFWMIPVLAHGWNGRQFLMGGALAVLAALTYLLPLWLAPEVFSAWTANVLTSLETTGTGSNVYGAVDAWLASPERPWLPYVAQLAYAGLLAALLVLGRMRGRQLWAALLLAAIFMNPRPLGYDLAIAAIPFAFLLATLLPERLGGGHRLAMSTAASAGAMMLSYNDAIASAAILLPLLAAGLMTACALQPARLCILAGVGSRRGARARPAGDAKSRSAAAIEAEAVS